MLCEDIYSLVAALCLISLCSSHTTHMVTPHMASFFIPPFRHQHHESFDLCPLVIQLVLRIFKWQFSLSLSLSLSLSVCLSLCLYLSLPPSLPISLSLSFSPSIRRIVGRRSLTLSLLTWSRAQRVNNYKTTE